MNPTAGMLCWILGWAAFVACAGLAVGAWLRREPAPGWGTAGFLATAMLSIVAFRAPILHVPFELHPDESQLISGGMMLSHDPVFWRAVDGNTSGPLNHYALVVPAMLAGERPYLAARVLGLVLTLLTVAGVFFAARAVFAETAARVGLLPFAAFLAFAAHPEHVHHGSEHVPMALIALALACVVRHFVHGSRGALFGVGVICAALPLAKLQTGPIAVAIFGSAACLLLWRASSRAERWRAVAPLVMGAATVVLALALYATVFGLWRDMKLSYLDSNLSWVRASRPSDLGMLSRLVWRSFQAHGALFLWVAPFAALLACAIARGAKGAAPRWAFGLIGVVVVAAFVSLANAGQGSPKYFLLMVPGLGLLGAAVFSALETRRDTARFAWGAGAAAFLVLGVALPARMRAGMTSERWPHYPDYFPTRERVMPQIVAELKRWVGPNDFLAAWPGPPECYVRVGCRQATRDGEASRQSIASPERDYFRARYLRDIRASRPKAFLDYTRPNRRGFEVANFPELARYLEENYRLETDIAGWLIYVRRDLPPAK